MKNTNTINDEQQLPANHSQLTTHDSPSPHRRGPRLDHRSTWQRLCRIDDWIRSGTYPNKQSMARKLGVTVRTVTRDLQFMKEEKGLPIEYDARRYGFYYSKPVQGFAQTPISQNDLLPIMVAHKSVAQYRGLPFEKPLRSTFEKLSGQLDDRERNTIAHLGNALAFRPIAPEECDGPHFQKVKKAIEDRRELKFRYRNWGKKRVIPRRLQPYQIVCCDSRWYVVGYEVRQCQVRTFAMARLMQPRLMRSHFPKPKRFDLDAYLQGSLGMMKGDPAKTWPVIIDLDQCGADLVRGRRWHPTQELTNLEDGGCRLTLKLNSLEEIERHVLSWGVHATVVEPPVLRHRLACIASELSAAYADALMPDSPALRSACLASIPHLKKEADEGGHQPSTQKPSTL